MITYLILYGLYFVVECNVLLKHR